MRHLDLCSGIGGFALAARMVGGIETVGFCEIDAFCKSVLAKHWPGVPQFPNIHFLSAKRVDSGVSLCYSPWTLEGETNMPLTPTARWHKLSDGQIVECISLYKKGMSIGDVAEYFGVSRQSMWKSLVRRGVKMRPQQRNGQDNHFARGGINCDKQANRIVERAVKKGVLIPQPCEVCGAIELIGGHHDDYNKPLTVRWFCKKHHFDWHKTHKARGREVQLDVPGGIDILTGGVP